MTRSLFRSATALLILTTSLLKSASLVRADNPISPGFPYGSQKVRGTSLGGWLVLHPWITPSLFNATGNDQIIDEWTFCELQNATVARAALERHWDTFYTEADFAAMAAAGLNHVKVPIGYWAFEVSSGEPFILGQLPYVERAIGWAHKHGLKVIVDLYGAPGSQNGFINSGQIKSFPGWQSNQTNIDRTKAIIKTFTSMFASHTNVVPVIAPLNEPAGFFGADVLNAARQYYLDTYETIRHPFGNGSQSNTLVLIHDAFQPLSSWNDFMQPPDFQGVAMDTHHYQQFSDAELAQSEDQHIIEACSVIGNLSSINMMTIVGEWSTTRTDCARGLDGRGKGARYDGTYPNSTRIGSCVGLSDSASSFSSEYKTFLRRFYEAQVTTYEKVAGWIQWPWKTEEGAGEEWSYSKGLEYGWIPQDPTDRKYPNICG